MTENKKTTIKEQLYSKDKNIVIKAVKDLRETGKDSDLNALIEFYSKSEDKEVNQLIYRLFCDLRTQKSTSTIVNLIKSTTDKPTLKMLVSSCWQSRLNYIDSFELFIDLVIKESFEISLEAFTLIENFEEKTTEVQISKLIAHVKNSIKGCKENNLPLAVDLVKIIENYKV